MLLVKNNPLFSFYCFMPSSRLDNLLVQFFNLYLFCLSVLIIFSSNLHYQEYPQVDMTWHFYENEGVRLINHKENTFKCL